MLDSAAYIATYTSTIIMKGMGSHKEVVNIT